VLAPLARNRLSTSAGVAIIAVYVVFALLRVVGI
jgi:hypothetical protein